MLTLLGWFNGLFSIIILISGCASGVFFIYQSKKTHAKLLLYAGLMIILCFFAYFGSIIDFITILITNENAKNPYGIVGILNWVLIFPGGAFFVYFNSELLIPEKKKN